MGNKTNGCSCINFASLVNIIEGFLVATQEHVTCTVYRACVLVKRICNHLPNMDKSIYHSIY